MTDDDSMMMYSLHVMEQELTLIGLEYKMESDQVSEAVEQEGALKCRNDANSVLQETCSVSYCILNVCILYY